MADLLAVSLEPGRAVGQVALALLLADRHAQVGPLIAAVHAFSALGREQGDHVIADLERADSLADRLDHAGSLVPEHGRRVARGIDAGGGVEVGVADAAGDEADQRLARLRIAKADLLHDEGLAELLEYRGTHLHLQPLPLDYTAFDPMGRRTSPPPRTSVLKYRARSPREEGAPRSAPGEVLGATQGFARPGIRAAC